MQVSELDAPGAFQRIDDIFRTLSHRLDISERAQSEAQRAMSAAASEINAATRDQAEAFQLIATRIDRVERQTDTGALRDAVRGLHQGLSRLAHEIARTTDETSGRIAALNGNFEVLAGKMALTRDDSHHLGQALEHKLAVLDERAKDSEKRLEQAEERIAQVSQLAETVAALEERVNSTEERIQQSLGRYLTGIEHSLDQIGERLERSETRSESDNSIEQALRSLTARMDGAEGAAAPNNEASSLPDESQNTMPPGGPGDVAVLPLQAPLVAAELGAQPQPEAPPFVRMSEILREPPPDDLHVALPPFLRASTENYLAQARRAARSHPVDESLGMAFRLGGRPAPPTRRRISHPVAMACLVSLLMGAGFMVTRAFQRADMAMPGSPATIALDAPATKAAPAAPAALASASLFNFGSGAPDALGELVTRASGGDTRAAMILGLKYANGDGIAVDDVQAAHWLQQAALGGEAVAQYRLGTFYERGRAFAADPGQALRWYGEAASRGNRRAMHNLAVVYADGTGTEKNFPEAARWFRAAAELGLTDSQFNLAVLYERGLGVKPSLAEAYKWYSIAAEAGDAESKARVAAIVSQIAPADRDAADKAAKAYKPRPIDVAANDG
jgi:localization factor PodJL